MQLTLENRNPCCGELSVIKNPSQTNKNWRFLVLSQD